MAKASCKGFSYTRYTTTGAISERILFGIGALPGRKQSALWIIDEADGEDITRIRPIAYFKLPKDAALVREILEGRVRT